MHATSSAGAQAHLSGRLPLPQAALHQVIGQGFVDAKDKERCYHDRQSH